MDPLTEPPSDDEFRFNLSNEDLKREVSGNMGRQPRSPLNDCSTPPELADSEEAITRKKPSAWRLHCYGDLSKDRVRRKLHNTKSKVEAHVCYPWLRRLVFHLSHYFPNLHTSTSTNRQRSRERSLSGQRHSQSSRNRFAYNISEREERTDSQKTMETPLLHNTQDSFRKTTLVDSTDLSQRKVITSSNDEVHDRYNSHRKRRPLQRQKSSGIQDFDQLFAKNDHDHHHKSFNQSEGTVPNLRLSKEMEAISTFDMPSVPLRETEQCTWLSEEDLHISGTKAESPSVEQRKDVLTTTRRRTPPTKKTRQKAKTKLHPQTGRVENADQQGVENQETYDITLSKVAEQLNSDNILLDKIMSAQGRKNSLPYHPFQEEPLLLLRRNSPESQNFIQYKRVKARRNSSNSQAEFIPPTDYSSRMKSGELATGEEIYKAPVQKLFLVEDRDSVKAHVESWLEEAVNITRQKQSRRLAQLYHLSSGDAVYKGPQVGVTTTLPHSVDVPVACDSFDQHNAYPFVHRETSGANMKPTITPISQPSTDSVQRMVPSLTVDSNDNGPTCLLEESTEQEGPFQMLQAGLTTASYYPMHRRHSDNPLTRTKAVIHTSTSTESSASRFSTQHRRENFHTSVGSERWISKPALSARESLIHSNLSQQSESFQADPRISMQLGEISRPNIIKLAFLRQSHSFSNTRRGSRSPTVLSAQQDSLSSGGIPVLLARRSSQCRNNPQSALQNLRTSDIVGRPRCVMCSTGRHPRCTHRPCSQFTSNLTGQLSEESSSDVRSQLLNQPMSSAIFERRYSKHLKPMDAWQCRQSHSMELVHTGALTVSPTERQTTRSKATLQRQVPIICSRSMQQSTGSFPIPYCEFLSGPELSLASTLESTSITPDSQKNRNFFNQSTESGRSISIHKTSELSHGHSPLASPRLMHARTASNEQRLSSNFSPNRRQQFLCTKLLPYPQQDTGRNGERKARSFEMSLSFEHTSQLPTQTYLVLPNYHSSDSSRRNSALSNNSAQLWTEREYQVKEPAERPAPHIPLPNTSVIPGKLVPPDLIFSPASRRASLLDDGEGLSSVPLIPGSLLNLDCDVGYPSFQYSESHLRDCAGDGSDVAFGSETWSGKNVQSLLEHMDVSKHKWKHGSTSSAHTLHSEPRRHSQLRRSFQEMYSPSESAGLLAYGYSRSPQSVKSSVKDVGRCTKSQTDLCQKPCYLASATYGSQSAVERFSTPSHTNDLNQRDAREEPYKRCTNSDRESFQWMKVVDVSPRKGEKWCKDPSDRNEINIDSKLEPRYHKKEKSALAVKDKDHSGGYLFRSTGDSTVNPEILQPSLGPVLDSSEENMTDIDNEESCVREQIKRSLSSKSKKRDLSAPKSTLQDQKLSGSEHHAARRRSFLAGYWQQAIRQSGDTSLDSFETLRTDTES
ncbi:hypothetical protein CRM22_007856 [Opisthorchis felineus]|uniref:Uncharacterized protein n=1 Tax=Opisthorchis felineus TaxID=147828 RepID=A0A4S2LDW3_OPIFE|nr:hypothetical protein CRM22_007856 [Opisthorchis felineus]